MLPCMYKSIFGIDCPGCGFQRSCIALLRGHWKESLAFYPATIPILITAIFLLLNIKYRFSKSKVIKNALYITVGIIIIVSYSIKMWGVYQHHNVSI